MQGWLSLNSIRAELQQRRVCRLRSLGKYCAVYYICIPWAGILMFHIKTKQKKICNGYLRPVFEFWEHVVTWPLLWVLLLQASFYRVMFFSPIHTLPVSDTFFNMLYHMAVKDTRWNLPSDLFHIHELTDTHNWLLSLWMTGEREYTTPLKQRAQSGFALLSPEWIIVCYTSQEPH